MVLDKACIERLTRSCVPQGPKAPMPVYARWFVPPGMTCHHPRSPVIHAATGNLTYLDLPCTIERTTVTSSPAGWPGKGQSFRNSSSIFGLDTILQSSCKRESSIYYGDHLSPRVACPIYPVLAWGTSLTLSSARHITYWVQTHTPLQYLTEGSSILAAWPAYIWILASHCWSLTQCYW